MPKDGMHEKFKKVLIQNLMHAIDDEETPLYVAYKEFSECKWNKNNNLILKPDKLSPKAKLFLNFVDECESKIVPWYIVNRQCGLSDSNFQRCINTYRSRFLFVQLPNNQRINLGILDYFTKINKCQLNLRIPDATPCISGQTARLMRQIYILNKKYPELVKYNLDSDTDQFKQILENWFQENYTIDGEGIGYPRRRLLEECNDMINANFGCAKMMYCHDPAWRHLLKLIGCDDTQQKGSYLRLPVWLKDKTNGGFIKNTRNSCGPGGEFTIQKRKHHRLNNRQMTDREKDAVRKSVENERKKKRYKKI